MFTRASVRWSPRQKSMFFHGRIQGGIIGQRILRFRRHGQFSCSFARLLRPQTASFLFHGRLDRRQFCRSIPRHSRIVLQFQTLLVTYPVIRVQSTILFCQYSSLNVSCIPMKMARAQRSGTHNTCLQCSQPLCSIANCRKKVGRKKSAGSLRPVLSLMLRSSTRQVLFWIFANCLVRTCFYY